MKAAVRNRLHVVAGLILREGRLLVCQRHMNSAFPLKWEFPGGKVENDELPKDALKRELREELGIEVLESQEIFQQKHRYPAGPDVFLNFFQVLQYEGEVKNLVFQQLCWAEIKELAEIDFLAGDRPLIKILVGADGKGLLL
jgi:8-oxo-dGTP diphosphatase